MNKQTIVVTVNVPEGYELTGEYRAPKLDEPFISSGGTLWKCTSEQCAGSPRLILREVWGPPKWLPEGCWVWMWDGNWWVGPKEPQPATYNKYEWCGVHENNAVTLAKLFGAEFVPPPVHKIQIHHPESDL